MNKVYAVLLKQGKLLQADINALEEANADKTELEQDFMAIVTKVKSNELDTNAKIGAEFKKAIARQDKRDARALAREQAKQARIDARKLARKSQ